jgi:hypothetical protein
VNSAGDTAIHATKEETMDIMQIVIIFLACMSPLLVALAVSILAISEFPARGNAQHSGKR